MKKPEILYTDKWPNKTLFSICTPIDKSSGSGWAGQLNQQSRPSQSNRQSALKGRQKLADALFFYDVALEKSPSFKKWIRQFPNKIALKSGESLKTLKSLEQTLYKVQKIVNKDQVSTKDINFIAVGGGSIGDFVGFMASTYQRGKSFIQIPTTWLAAIDSAHGGKNGLNLGGAKNQIGTFYPAQKIIICKEALFLAPEYLAQDAFSEAVKISLISTAKTLKTLKPNRQSLYKHLPQLIKAKYTIVNKDPLEQKGHRRVLNLGHTMGHVFETAYGFSHGQSIFYGLLFALRFSLYRNYISWNVFQQVTDVLFQITYPQSYQQVIRLNKAKVLKLLKQDKKNNTKDTLDFIFIKKIGVVSRETVTYADILNELQRQQREL